METMSQERQSQVRRASGLTSAAGGPDLGRRAAVKALCAGILGVSAPKRASAQPAMERVVTNSLGMKLSFVPAGMFMMGSDSSEIGRRQDEGPQQAQWIGEAFFLGIHEVTVGQFRKFVEDSGFKSDAEKDGKGGWTFDPTTGQLEQKPACDWRDPGFPQEDDHPVVNVSWNDAMAFCAWLSLREGLPYRLPTEREWEYACRAGTTTPFWSGDRNSLAGAANLADASLQRKYPMASWSASWDDGHAYTAPVGRYRPNDFGLYDMHGNVWEWLADGYDGGYPATDSASSRTPRQPAFQGRVLRGGSWYNWIEDARSASRDWDTPDYRNFDTGFRIARTVMS